MKDLPHVGLPEKESTVPGPYGQCRTQVARGDIGQNFKIELGEPMCKYLCIVSFDTFCGFKWVKTCSKIHIKFIYRDITYFRLVIITEHTTNFENYANNWSIIYFYSIWITFVGSNGSKLVENLYKAYF